MNVTVAGFVPNPPGRGTLGLVWECLFSYVLCLWTAIHVDFDPTNFVGFATANSKIHWSLMIFFLPEYALTQVISEYWMARQFCKVRNRGLVRVPTIRNIDGLEESITLTNVPLRSHNDLDNASGRRSGRSAWSEVEHISSCPVSLNLVGGDERWGIEHGYLIRMGVLKFKLKDTRDLRSPTTSGIERLSECALLPTPKFLNGRIQVLSKSDGLAKTVVCFQVFKQLLGGSTACLLHSSS